MEEPGGCASMGGECIRMIKSLGFVGLKRIEQKNEELIWLRS